MYLPQWIRVIRENTANRLAAYEICFTNLQTVKPLVMDLPNWQTKTVPELEEMVTGLRQGHLLLLVDKMSYLATLRDMGALENLIYSPQVHKHQKALDEALEAFEQMIATTTEVIVFLKEYNVTGLIPNSIGGGK